MKITISYPKSLKSFGMNSIYAGKHWTKRQKDKDYWHWLVHSELNRQKIKKVLFEKPVAITFYWNDKIDIDNHAYMAKMIVDAFKGHLIVDDTRKYYTKCTHEFYGGDVILVEIRESRGINEHYNTNRNT